ncbi:hypothetical protein V7166_09130, partial [Bacillus thuringiensis]
MQKNYHLFLAIHNPKNEQKYENKCLKIKQTQSLRLNRFYAQPDAPVLLKKGFKTFFVTTQPYISFRSLVRSIIPAKIPLLPIIAAMKIKMNLHLAAFLCFQTLRVAGKDTDRYYT